MRIALTTDDLQKLCRICLNDGELNLCIKVKLPIDADNDDALEQQEISVREMMQVFGELQLSEQLQLLCHNCLNTLLPCYVFYQKMQAANKRLQLVYSAMEKCKTEAEIEIDASDADHYVEYLLDNQETSEWTTHKDNEIDASVDFETLMDDKTEEPKQIEDDLLIEEDDIVEAPFENLLKVPLTPPPAPSIKNACKRKLNKNPKFILTDGVANMLTHMNNTDITPITTLQSRLTNSTNLPKRSRIANVPSLPPQEDASFVVTQFVPSTSQIHLESTDLAQNGILSDSMLPANELCTIDYAAVEIKSSNIQQMCEEPTVKSNADIYICKYCPQAYSAPHYLMTHVRKAHVCKFCTKPFVKPNDLYDHIRKMHSQHKCAICGKELSSHSNLRSHIKRLHGIKLPAQVALLDYRLPEVREV